MTSSETQLSNSEFEKLKNGDKQIFRNVYDMHVGFVQYVVKRCGVAESDRNDIVQETFFRLFHRANEIKNQETLKSWLIVCARNLSLDYLRKQKRRSTETVADFSDETRSYWSGTSDTHERELELQLVGRLIHQIYVETGDVTLKLFYNEGLSIKEIASRTGESIGTVTSRLCRLRKKYHRRFEEHIETLRASFY